MLRYAANMSARDEKPSTGLPGLDDILKGVLPGDNIVWQVDSIDDYKALVLPYSKFALDSGRKLIYFRFASHGQLLPDDHGAEIYKIDPADGFESFITTIHDVIEKAGYGAYYVFDCLSELAGDWSSDQMLGNFFMLTCPYLYDLETVTYFALSRNMHSNRAIDPIVNTTQLFLDVVHHKDNIYIRPIKCLHRFSPTMNMMHKWSGDDFTPVSSSVVISEIRSNTSWSVLGADRKVGLWDRALLEANEALERKVANELPPEEETAIRSRLCRMLLSRDDAILPMLSEHFSLHDIIQVANRMIGTGLIGGKAVGMLLAGAILKQKNERFAGLLEDHDNFYIGSDVFYSFLVQNGIWWVRQKQKNPETFMQDSEQARRRILTGEFPNYIVRQLEDMLDYFGQAPFIVRSSSLLEDNFGNSFAGKYDSVFCTNQGPRQRRLDNFIAAIRTIYASTMSEKALEYRNRRGMLEHDEQMALLVMRVSGQMHERNFFPDAAGVGFSFNPYAWHKSIDPKAGVIRIVFGLGTRAVERFDEDYTRVVALNEPSRRPESNFEEVAQYSQKKVDYLDLECNQLVSGDFLKLLPACKNIPIELFASLDKTRMQEREGRRPGSGPQTKPWIVTFDNLLTNTEFVTDMKNMLSILEEAYNYPVDIEFTVNCTSDKEYKINLVQCRPLQVQGTEIPEMPDIDVPEEKAIIKSHGAVIGQSRIMNIDHFVYVVPSIYGNLPLRDRYDIANMLGKINHSIAKGPGGNIMLLGPGRWGTSTPSLGIPVTFSHINHISVLCEIVTMRKDLVPDVSLGTHFLNELVEMNILYLAMLPEEGKNLLNEDFFLNSPNSLNKLVPASEKWQEIIKVVSASCLPDEMKNISLHANAAEQEVLCYFDEKK